MIVLYISELFLILLHVLFKFQQMQQALKQLQYNSNQILQEMDNEER